MNVDPATGQVAGVTPRPGGDFFAYEESFRGGVFVAAGDLDGDGKAEIVLGTGVGGGPRVRAVRGTADHAELLNLFAYEDSARNGVRVAAGDVNGDGKADVLLRNSADGQDTGWLMDGLAVRNSAFWTSSRQTRRRVLRIASLPSGRRRARKPLVRPTLFSQWREASHGWRRFSSPIFHQRSARNMAHDCGSSLLLAT